MENSDPPAISSADDPNPPAFHRRCRSDDMSMQVLMDPLISSSAPASRAPPSDEGLPSDDDRFSSFIDVNNVPSDHPPPPLQLSDSSTPTPPPSSSSSRHTRRNSSEAASEIMDAKKAMSPDKLAELWSVDPKRAKRIMANRQSAARSKERKARYIHELESKVQTLQNESTTLSAQLSLFQRDTSELATENTDLKFKLQALEQHAQMREALNNALQKEVERLKAATGEISDSIDLGLHHHNQYNPPPILPLPGHQGSTSRQNTQTPAFSLNHPSEMSNSQTVPDFMQNDHIGRLNGLDISNHGSSIVNCEGPSVSSASGSSSAY